jgi:signal peptidase I
MTKHLLRHSKHVRLWREDVLSPRDTSRLLEQDSAVKHAMGAGDVESINRAADTLSETVLRLTPRMSVSWMRENLEVLVVAISIAMAFKSYFLQPFKIPTGSMQPTLYGIQSRAVTGGPGLLDQWPLKFGKWLITGEWYTRIVVTEPGRLLIPYPEQQTDEAGLKCYIGTRQYLLPKDARNAIESRANDYIYSGTVLWEGMVKAGDHVLVDKMTWNYRKPKRGDVIVFRTDGIAGLMPKTHYIKRLVGLPGESLSISPPGLCVNGTALDAPQSIAAISRRLPPHDRPPYNAGYTPPLGPEARYLRSPDEHYAIPDRQYFALGDNTANSRDSRYWGTVSETNMVGRAVFVYWPFVGRWGPIR